MWSHLLKKSLTENFIFCAVIGSETPVRGFLFNKVVSLAA